MSDDFDDWPGNRPAWLGDEPPTASTIAELMVRRHHVGVYCGACGKRASLVLLVLAARLGERAKHLTPADVRRSLRCDGPEAMHAWRGRNASVAVTVHHGDVPAVPQAQGPPKW